MDDIEVIVGSWRDTIQTM
ncbi:hypothetical protein LINPERPRIM_LOCUS20064 [Linum perenne]